MTVNAHHNWRPLTPTVTQRDLHRSGIGSFLRTEGDASPLCDYGMLGSSFGYGNCANWPRGFRRITWNLRLRLADRPAAHDYSWTSLGIFARTP
jgi:hypothetical protein